MEHLIPFYSLNSITSECPTLDSRGLLSVHLLTANTGKTLFRVASWKNRACQWELDAAVGEAGTSSWLVALQKALWPTRGILLGCCKPMHVREAAVGGAVTGKACKACSALLWPLLGRNLCCGAVLEQSKTEL